MAKKVKKRVDPEDNSRARKLILLIAGILLWFNGLSTAALINEIVIEGSELNRLATLLTLVIFICFLVGMISIFYPFPEGHYLIYLGAIINLIFSLILWLNGNSAAYLQGMLSFLLLYLGFRFPLKFEQSQYVLRN